MDEFNRKWIIEHGVPISQSYYGDLTIRALYYRLVALGMTNSQQHYKRVVGAMIKARWDGLLNFDSFKDHERNTLGETPFEETSVEGEVESAKESIDFWMSYYSKNKWENQPKYVEVFIEKKALQGVFDEPCKVAGVALSPCKGYPSLTFVYDAGQRISRAVDEGKEAIILYFGDYDPSGEDIPRSLQDTMHRMGVDVRVERVLLMEDQVLEMNLPPAPTKMTDSRSRTWDGLGQVELDAVEPGLLREIVSDSISNHFDSDLHGDLLALQREEKIDYKDQLKEYVRGLK